jgi:hypothetical protein
MYLLLVKYRDLPSVQSYALSFCLDFLRLCFRFYPLPDNGIVLRVEVSRCRSLDLAVRLIKSLREAYGFCCPARNRS